VQNCRSKDFFEILFILKGAFGSQKESFKKFLGLFWASLSVIMVGYRGPTPDVNGTVGGVSGNRHSYHDKENEHELQARIENG